MKPIEPQLEQLRERVNTIDTAPAHQKIEAHLRSAWKETRSTQAAPAQTKTHRWNLSRWTLVLSGSGIGVLALMTAMLTPAPVAQRISSTAQYTERAANPTTSGTIQLDSATSNLRLGSSSAGVSVSDLSIAMPEMIIDDGYGYRGDEDKDYTYIDNEEAKQLFNESVVLSIDVKQDILDVLSTLRTRIAEQKGYLINIAYYDTSGTLQIKLPADQLPSFEDQLKAMDVNHKITVISYNVANMSEEVTAIDANITSAQSAIEDTKVKLNATGISDGYKKILEDQIKTQEKYIETQKTDRTETIAEANLVSIRLVVNEYQSFWDGNYYQYDTSTFSGLTKYQFGKALYSLIHGSSKVLGFVIWLAVYSVIYIPIFLVLRKVVRSIRRKIKARKNSKM